MAGTVACETVVILSLALFAAVYGVTWKDCGSKMGKPTNVIVAGCPAQGICVLHKGVNASFGVDFKSDEDATGLKMLVYGHIAGVDVPFPIDNPDGCKGSNISCPIKKNQQYSYRNIIFIKTEYPSLSLAVKLKLVDQSSGVIACVVMPVKIQSVTRRKNVNSVLRYVRMQ